MAKKKYQISVDDIKIVNFIFHIVHKEGDEPELMNRTPIGIYDRFFRERICEVWNGNQCFFNDVSDFLDKLKEVDRNPLQFDAISRNLAIDFHNKKYHRIKPGAMIFMKIAVDNTTKYVIIKYDNENVLTYTKHDNEAILAEISNTFSKNKNALQKAAIIDTYSSEPYAVVTDKTDSNIADFFKSFLGIKRKYDNKLLTEKIRAAFIKTATEFKADLPDEFLRNTSSNFYKFIENNEEFVDEEFIPKIFGVYHIPEINTVFERKLEEADILGETFVFDKTTTKPNIKRYKTDEGITIQFPIEAEDTIGIHSEDGTTIITIKTSKLYEEHVKPKTTD